MRLRQFLSIIYIRRGDNHMVDADEIGRLNEAEAAQKVKYDAPEKTVSALLSKVDELTDKIAALCAKLDADGGVTDTDYAAEISDDIAKIELTY
jgi:hypothetical protein